MFVVLIIVLGIYKKELDLPSVSNVFVTLLECPYWLEANNITVMLEFGRRLNNKVDSFIDYQERSFHEIIKRGHFMELREVISTSFVSFENESNLA